MHKGLLTSLSIIRIIFFFRSSIKTQIEFSDGHHSFYFFSPFGMFPNDFFFLLMFFIPFLFMFWSSQTTSIHLLKTDWVSQSRRFKMFKEIGIRERKPIRNANGKKKAKKKKLPNKYCVWILISSRESHKTHEAAWTIDSICCGSANKNTHTHE